MKIITLIGDWKLRDPYVGMFKGRLTSEISNITIFDITHSVELYNIEQTAFLLKNSFHSFPKSSLHIILTGLSFSEQSRPVIIGYEDHFFMGEDNGVFSLMLGSDLPSEAWVYAQDKENGMIDKMVEMAGAFFAGKLSKLAVPYTQIKKKLKFDPVCSLTERTISGHIAYIDSCCNAVTDIPVAMFKTAIKNGKFRATISSSRHIQITRYHNFYDCHEEEVFFVFNRLGFLEITMYQGNIAVLGDLKVGDSVEITF